MEQKPGDFTIFLSGPCDSSEIDGVKREVCESLINKLCSSFSDGIHFVKPISSLRTNEVDLVQGVLRALQGLSSPLFYWDLSRQMFCAKKGIYLTHLSHTGLHVLLSQFMYAATCLKLVDALVNRMETSVKLPPTLRAFSCSVSAWLKRLRNIALKEEMKMKNSDTEVTPTLLGLASSLSSLCSGAEHLLQLVRGAIPQVYFESTSSIPHADIIVHVLDYLYKKLDQICLVQGGEDNAYWMLLHIFVGSLLPYIECLDSWLFEGTLDDPFEEMFFYASRAISVDEPQFWEKSYLLRPVQSQKLNVKLPTHDHIGQSNDKKEMAERESISSTSHLKGKEHKNKEILVCPLFIKDIARSIVSAGKSLQLIQHLPSTLLTASRKDSYSDPNGHDNPRYAHHYKSIVGLSLSEAFCVSLAGLIGHGDHISKYLWKIDGGKLEISPVINNGNGETLSVLAYSEKIWYKFLIDALEKKKVLGLESGYENCSDFPCGKEGTTATGFRNALLTPFCSENPIISISRTFLDKNRDTWEALNLSRKFDLPPLNDEVLRKAIFGDKSGPPSVCRGTNYTFGFQFCESEHLRSQDDTKLLEALLPFPTILPCFQDDLHMSELLPFQKNSTLPSRVLSWIQNIEPAATPLPVVVMQECLTIYIRRQVHYVGRVILSKLMNDWRLMDELAVLRAIYLLGSGDLLQHFLTVIFNKLDKGETWDDDFELNTILQESIRNSADGMLLRAPDSLVVSIIKGEGLDTEEQPNIAPVPTTPRKSRGHGFGIDGLDLLKFTYKVPWPLELIANTEAIKKYNQVMTFLLKVKHAKFVLDKARRWMWKAKGSATPNRKHHWLVEQKLLHFVDAFHQYVMDRVYHTAWRELCEGMAAAGSLDEVIEVHEAYLLSIQRQCFVVPDKLWALIANRINSILGLALDFYSIQHMLGSDGAVSATKARCEMEVDRIEKQFDDCIAFLLRVLSFKLNVGNFPHLADLVTRINYNYYYISDSGNPKMSLVPKLSHYDRERSL